jgi:hypothetical protein
MFNDSRRHMHDTPFFLAAFCNAQACMSSTRSIGGASFSSTPAGAAQSFAALEKSQVCQCGERQRTHQQPKTFNAC